MVNEAIFSLALIFLAALQLKPLARLLSRFCEREMNKTCTIGIACYLHIHTYHKFKTICLKKLLQLFNENGEAHFLYTNCISYHVKMLLLYTFPGGR